MPKMNLLNVLVHKHNQFIQDSLVWDAFETEYFPGDFVNWLELCRVYMKKIE